jgi:hypothetical protein
MNQEGDCQSCCKVCRKAVAVRKSKKATVVKMMAFVKQQKEMSGRVHSKSE